MKPVIGSESRFLPTPSAFDAPVAGGGRRNIAMTFGMENLEWCGYSMVKIFSEDMFIPFDRIHERDRQTDGHTDTDDDDDDDDDDRMTAKAALA